MGSMYIYGVVDATASAPAVPGIGGGELGLVAGDGLAAVVSPVPDGELEMDAQAIRAHAGVLEAANAAGAVLPMRFGIVMDDTEVRDRLLDAHRSDLLAQLREFAGMVELKLRATYEEEPLLREIVASDQDVARLRESLRGAPADATYYGQIRLGELVTQAIERKREGDAAEIIDALSPLAVAVDLAPVPHERVVVNASFLVQRDRVEDFDVAVDRVGGSQSGRMRFAYTGPFPPHSFVTLAAEV